VYGKSAQHKMQNAHVLIVGEGHLASEVAKNLALSGIGKISLYSIDGSTTKQAELSSRLGRVVSIMGEDDSLLSYTKSLNFHNQVGM
jgi:tRNA A37 threonylcarbamoyladenosine dehydratase